MRARDYHASVTTKKHDFLTDKHHYNQTNTDMHAG